MGPWPFRGSVGGCSAAPASAWRFSEEAAKSCARILSQARPHQAVQGIEALPHVHGLGVPEDPDRPRRADHPSFSKSFAADARSNPSSRYPAGETSVSDLAVRPDPGIASPLTDTGTKAPGLSSSPASIYRLSAEHATPSSRATSTQPQRDA